MWPDDLKDPTVPQTPSDPWGRYTRDGPIDEPSPAAAPDWFERATNSGWGPQNLPELTSAPSLMGGTPPGGWAAWFNTLTAGKPPTPATLLALRSDLAQYGIDVLANANNVAGKIRLPTGQIIDVIQGAEQGGRAWQWNTASGAYGSLNTPYGESFSYEPYGGTPSFSGGGFEMGTFAPTSGPVTPFVAPDVTALQQDPSFQVRVKEGEAALQSSAAARGTLLTGGTLKGLQRYGQDLASKEYADVYNRALSTWGANAENADRSYAREAGTYGINAAQTQNAFDRAYATYGANTQAKQYDWMTNYQKAINEYQMRYGIWNTGTTNRFNRLYSLGSLGANAANTYMGAA